MDVDFVRDCFEKQNENFETACDEMIERRGQLESAQLKTAEELETLRKDLERIEQKQDENQKSQAKDAKKSYNVSLIALGLNALTIIVSVLLALLH